MSPQKLSPKSSEKIRNFPEVSKRFPTHRNAPDCIRSYPNASKQVQTRPKTFKNIRNPKKLHENFARTSRLGANFSDVALDRHCNDHQFKRFGSSIFLLNGVSEKISKQVHFYFFRSDRKRSPKGPRTDPERTPNGPRTDPKRTPNAPRTDLERTPNRPRADSARTRRGRRTDSERTPNRPRTDPERTPVLRNLLRNTVKTVPSPAVPGNARAVTPHTAAAIAREIKKPHKL